MQWIFKGGVCVESGGESYSHVYSVVCGMEAGWPPITSPDKPIPYHTTSSSRQTEQLYRETIARASTRQPVSIGITIYRYQCHHVSNANVRVLEC